MESQPNRLINESSAYLKQHAHNPVSWFPWGEEALEKAKKENKLLFISIGYSACHWCHVMEKESFRNKEIATILNKNYISIKIDREERPDIDNVYMSAIQLINGSGGWPLSCIATPDARPFYGGTYYPPAQFLNIITELSSIWQANPEKIENHANGLCDGIKNSELIKERNPETKLLSPQNFIKSYKSAFDESYGGLNQVPKFPMPVLHRYLLRYHHYTGDETVLKHAEKTANAIITGGIYDQVGGGISRYSTDKKWLVPHFEKMLYDNAQLISFLSELYSIKKDENYLTAIRQTSEFIERELKSASGGYFASLDADSEGEEGTFYAWKFKELKEISGDEFPILSAYYGVNKQGNWEKGKNILSIENTAEKLAKDFHTSKMEMLSRLSKLKKMLFDHREQRLRPSPDNKILTSWNALLLDSYVSAYQATADHSYLQKAEDLADFLAKRVFPDENAILYHSPERRIKAFLDDYAFLTLAYINLYQAGFNEKWLNKAQSLIRLAMKYFYNPETGMFFFSSIDEQTPVTHQYDLIDNVMPSSNAIMARVLYYASIYLENNEYDRIARQMLINVQEYFPKSANYFPEWMSLSLVMQSPFSEVVITGNGALEKRREFCGNFLPSLIFAGGESESSDVSLLKGKRYDQDALLYVCRNRTCKMPVKEVSEALKQIHSV